MLRAARVFDEHLLNEPICVLHVLVVMPLADFADIGKLVNSELSSALAEGLEHVFRLTSQHDVGDKSREITLPWCVCQLLCHPKCGSGDALQSAADVVERARFSARVGVRDAALELLQHPLMLSHARDVPRAEISKTLILSNGFVVDDRTQEKVVLHHGVANLTSEEIDSAFHRGARSVVGRTPEVHNTRHVSRTLRARPT